MLRGPGPGASGEEGICGVRWKGTEMVEAPSSVRGSLSSSELVGVYCPLVPIYSRNSREMEVEKTHAS